MVKLVTLQEIKPVYDKAGKRKARLWMKVLREFQIPEPESDNTPINEDVPYYKELDKYAKM